MTQSAAEREVKAREVLSYDLLTSDDACARSGRRAMIGATWQRSEFETGLHGLLESDEWAHTLQAVTPLPGDLVLDCGCGRGLTSTAFSILGCHVVAVDLNPSRTSGIGVLRTQAPDSVAGPVLAVADAERCPFSTDTFDLVYCRQLLHHSYCLLAMVQELVRVLKPGGVFYAYGDHRHPWWSGDGAFRRMHHAVPLGANEHSYRVGTYRRVLRRAGLVELDLRPVEPLLFQEYPVPLYHRLALLTTRIPVLGPPLFRAYRRVQWFRGVGSQLSIRARKPTRTVSS